MDDAKIASDMTLDGIAQRLEKIQSDVTALQTNMSGMKADMTDMKADMTGMKADMTGMKADMETVKADVKTGFNGSKVRDEELRSLMKFGLEAREALRESVEARFDATDQKHDEEISLLKDILRAVRRSP
jgi:capsule polysaccharide export protein KpsE/RkpR